MRKVQKYFPSPIVLITILFILSRLFYYWMGIRFDGQTLEHSWYILDLNQLKNNLLQSLLYLHISPPLFNLYVGLVFKFFPNASNFIFNISFLIAGYLQVVFLYLVLREFKIKQWLNFLLVGLYIFNPVLILYENWFQFTYFVTLFQILSIFLLIQFLKSKKLFFGFLFFLSLAVIALLRSTYHLVWLAAILIVMLWFLPTIRKKVLLAGLIPLLMVFSWYAKNYFIFGEFASSTWLGMHWSKTTIHMIPENVRQDLVEKGELSEISLLYPFKPLDTYEHLIKSVPKTGIPVLDERTNSFGEPNYNNIEYLQVSDLFLKEVKQVIKKYPAAYKSGLIFAWEIYFRSPTEFIFVADNRDKINGMVDLYNTFYYGVFGDWIYKFIPRSFLEYIDLSQIGFFSILNLLIAFGLGVWAFFKLLLRKDGGMPDLLIFTLLMVCITVVYTALISNIFDVAENNRYRVEIEPLYMIVMAFVYNRIILYFHDHFSKDRNRQIDLVSDSAE